jgi:hypothetical protein
MDTKERLALLNEVLKHRSLIRANLPDMREKKHKRDATPPGLRRTHGINLWTPMFKTGQRATGLTVPCGEDTPDREQFCVLMRQHMEGMILSNPTDAQMAVEDFSDMWETSDLDAIQLKFPVAEWPAQLVSCDEFNRTLETIGWGYRNPPARPLGEPCSLREFLVAVWGEHLPI